MTSAVTASRARNDRKTPPRALRSSLLFDDGERIGRRRARAGKSGQARRHGFGRFSGFEPRGGIGVDFEEAPFDALGLAALDERRQHAEALVADHVDVRAFAALRYATIRTAHALGAIARADVVASELA